MATEQHLKQAHYLLAATFPNDGPEAHFGMSAAIMTLLAIAATSAIRSFDLKKNQKAGRDRASFVKCVSDFFPWDRVTIEDCQHRPKQKRQEAAAEALYDVFRNPLVHSGGVTSEPHLSGQVGNWFRTPKIIHMFPGLASPQENERAIADYCAAELRGDKMIELEAFSAKVHTRPLYWCTRRMIESFAADPEMQKDIADNLQLVSRSP